MQDIVGRKQKMLINIFRLWLIKICMERFESCFNYMEQKEKRKWEYKKKGIEEHKRKRKKNRKKKKSRRRRKTKKLWKERVKGKGREIEKRENRGTITKILGMTGFCGKFGRYKT